MGKNKRYRRQIEGQRQALAEHLNKIEIEKAKPYPDWKLVEDWEKTVKNIHAQIEKLERRLKQ